MHETKIFPGIPVLERAQVVLASGSPRRRELLGRVLGTRPFTVAATNIDESQHSGEIPEAYVTRLALSKAEAGATQLPQATHETIVIGADTIVVLDGQIFGKPATDAESITFLEQLSGRTHQVTTGVALVLAGGDGKLIRHEVFTTTSEVEFRSLNRAEIEWYVSTGEPVDKAGAYAIQGFGGLLIAAVRGDYYNVVGLPVSPVIEAMRRF